MERAAARGLTVLRLALGVFFLFEGVAKIGWLADAGPLRETLERWLAEAPGPSRLYLETIAIPGAAVFARVVPLAELATGLALLLGVWTRLAAALAFLMVLSFHFASGMLFRYELLTNGYALPVLGGLAALALGGRRLPWSLGK